MRHLDGRDCLLLGQERERSTRGWIHRRTYSTNPGGGRSAVCCYQRGRRAYLRRCRERCGVLLGKQQCRSARGRNKKRQSSADAGGGRSRVQIRCGEREPHLWGNDRRYSVLLGRRGQGATWIRGIQSTFDPDTSASTLRPDVEADVWSRRPTKAGHARRHPPLFARCGLPTCDSLMELPMPNTHANHAPLHTVDVHFHVSIRGDSDPTLGGVVA